MYFNYFYAKIIVLSQNCAFYAYFLPIFGFLCMKLQTNYFFSIGRSGDERRQNNNNNNLERSKGGESSSLAEEHRQLQEKYKAMQERLRSGHCRLFLSPHLSPALFMSFSSDPYANKNKSCPRVAVPVMRLSVQTFNFKQSSYVEISGLGLPSFPHKIVKGFSCVPNPDCIRVQLRQLIREKTRNFLF
jgi:hypothetical protein